jgi:hypothetical protein
MPHPAVAPHIHKPLDVHGYFATKVTLNRNAGDLGPDAIRVLFRQLVNFGAPRYPRRIADSLGSHAANAVDRRQGHLDVFIRGEVYSCYTCHCFASFSLRVWVNPDQPCRCLWRGSTQITRTLPFRRIILQFRQIFFTDALTFIVLPQSRGYRGRPIPPPTNEDFFIKLSYCLDIR